MLRTKSSDTFRKKGVCTLWGETISGFFTYISGMGGQIGKKICIYAVRVQHFAKKGCMYPLGTAKKGEGKRERTVF